VDEKIRFLVDSRGRKAVCFLKNQKARVNIEEAECSIECKMKYGFTDEQSFDIIKEALNLKNME
jgi:hypothetical protein